MQSAAPGTGRNIAPVATAVGETAEEQAVEVRPFTLQQFRNPPSPQDEIESKKIWRILDEKYQQFESVEEEQQRKEVLSTLN